MSLFAQLPQERGLATQPNKGPGPQHTYTPSGTSYDESLLDNFYTQKDHTQSQRIQHNMDAPSLPEKSSLRASRMFGMDTKLEPSVQSTEISQATPHDIYLSSEEDASSSADEFDFSDYDYDSETEDPQSPRRISHDNTAIVVSVVFMGKPSIIDLPALRRSGSPNSTEPRRRASTVSSVSSNMQRTATPTESFTSSRLQQSPRKNSLVSSLLSRRKPLFLNIDPYANGSSYSLDTGLKHETEENTALKTPRTPTAMFRNMSRTLSLVRKKSRPLLNTNIPMETSPESPEHEAELSVSEPAFAAPVRTQTEPSDAMRQSSLPAPRVTYQDIIKAAKKNSMMAPPRPSPISESHPEQSPTTPTTATRRGILSGLASKRRSVMLR